jgi:transposase
VEKIPQRGYFPRSETFFGTRNVQNWRFKDFFGVWGVLKMIKNSTLTSKQEKAIILLLQNKNVDEIAETLRVSRSTIYKWLERQDFKQRFAEVRQELFAEALEQLKVLTREAIATLEDILKNGTKETSRVTASKTVLELALRLKEVEELEKRVEELEKIVESRR